MRAICSIIDSSNHPCGSLAQLVEQRPEEPCVPSSSLGGATKYCISVLGFVTINREPHAGIAQLLERFLAMEEARS